MLTAIAILAWAAFCIFEGRFEALLWHMWAARPLVAFNPHKTGLLVLRRAAVIIAASLVNPWLAIGHALVFPFIHNGAMYAYRNDLNPLVYEKRWMAEPSNTSTAKINFTYLSRLIIFAFGLAIYILCLLR